MAIYNGNQKVKPSGVKNVYFGTQRVYRQLITYSVSGTGTNATINGSSSYSGTIQEGGTLTLTLGADGTSYKLPTKITVAGTEVTAGTSTVIPNKSTVLFTRTSNTAGTIAFSNVTDDVAFSVVGEVIQQNYNATFNSTHSSVYNQSNSQLYIKINSDTVSSSNYDYRIKNSTGTYRMWSSSSHIGVLPQTLSNVTKIMAVIEDTYYPSYVATYTNGDGNTYTIPNGTPVELVPNGQDTTFNLIMPWWEDE